MEVFLGPDGYKVEQNGFDYKFVFSCPECGKEWCTKEFSALFSTPPLYVTLHCYRKTGGCGKIVKITFNRR